MLWLAGLMGVAGVGAAAFVGLNTDVSDEDTDQALDDTDATTNPADLLGKINEYSAAGGPLQTDAPMATPSPVPSATTIGWGDDILNEMMAEFDEGAVQEPDDAPPPHHTLYSSAMLDDGEVETEAEAPHIDALLSDWIGQRDGAEILDYQAQTESLVVVWDDTNSDATEPEVSVAPAPDDPEVMQVSMNGEHVAEVYGDAELSVSDLTLIPLSSAVVVGLEAV